MSGTAVIGGEFPLDPLRLAELPDPAGWKGLPGFPRPAAVYLNSGRSAMLWGLRALGLVPGEIWVPEFICYSVIDALRRAGWEPRAYPLRDDMSADLQAWGRLWKRGSAPCLLVDFFGFPQPREARAFITGRGAPVIEDRTHSLWNEPGGEADMVFASLRKWLALPDGGVVRVRRAKSKPPREEMDGRFVATRLTALIARHHFLAAPEEDPVGEPYFLSRIAEAERRLDSDGALRRLSPLAAALLRSHDVQAMARRRRRNYRRLAAALQDRAAVRPLRVSVPAGCVPIGCPVLCRDRDGLRDWLRTQRIYCAVHWPHERWPKGWGSARAVAWSRRLMTLPIDQRLDPADIDRLRDCVIRYGHPNP